MVVNPLTFLWHYWLARRGESRWRDRESLERWQERMVLTHLRRVLPVSPWLRERFGGLPVERWREVPAVRKAGAMEHFDDWNTAGVRREEAMEVALKAERSRDFSPTLRGLTVGLSSGTSGGRGIFLASPAERAMWAATMLARVLPRPPGPDRSRGGLMGRHRIALFLRAGGGLYESAGRGRIQFRWFDLMRPAAGHWRDLEKFSPTILVAPPSLLGQVVSAGLSITPERIVSCAETLDAFDRKALKRAFGQPIHEVYQATEGFLGATDEAGILRLNEDVMVVEREWIGENRFVPVITDFRRFTQPMIRHRLEDVLVSHPDAGGIFTGLSSVEGRCEDQLGTADHTVPGDSVVRALLRAAELRDFRVRQTGLQILRVAILPDSEEIRGAVDSALRSLWAEFGQAGELTIHFDPMPEGETPGGKRRRIRQEWKSISAER